MPRLSSVAGVTAQTWPAVVPGDQPRRAAASHSRPARWWRDPADPAAQDRVLTRRSTREFGILGMPHAGPAPSGSPADGARAGKRRRRSLSDDPNPGTPLRPCEIEYRTLRGRVSWTLPTNPARGTLDLSWSDST